MNILFTLGLNLSNFIQKMTPTIVIMAAGDSSRYGSLKQFEKVGAANAYLFEYAIYDAIEAGFKKVVFIIKKEFKSYFKELEKKLANLIEFDFAFQLINSHENIQKTQRSKPWGTGHALLACKDLIHEPFVLMNADDYYGKSVFQILYEQLYTKCDHQLMIGYELGKTLSEYGNVNRGICTLDSNNFLQLIEELTNLNQKEHKNSSTIVSMNLWGLYPSIFEELEKRFLIFLDQSSTQLDKEFFLPSVVNELIKEHSEKFKVIATNEQWFGLTYNKDKMLLEEAISNKKYPKELWKS